MDLYFFVFFLPLIGALFMFLIEEHCFKAHQNKNNKIKSIVSLQSINMIISYLLSLLMLAPLVFSLVRFQVFSFSNWQVPIYFSFPVSILFLDFIHYVNHRLHHSVPYLWRLHRLHHTDGQVDSLITLLHHPLEVVSTFIAVVCFAVIFDVPTIALLVYGAFSAIHSAFTHFNQLIPEKINNYLKTFIVTPNFHRVHHSLNVSEGNSNFGNVFSIWDYLFRTTCLKTNADLVIMKFGVINHTTIGNLKECIKNPFI